MTTSNGIYEYISVALYAMQSLRFKQCLLTNLFHIRIYMLFLFRTRIMRQNRALLSLGVLVTNYLDKMTLLKFCQRYN